MFLVIILSKKSSINPVIPTSNLPWTLINIGRLKTNLFKIAVNHEIGNKRPCAWITWILCFLIIFVSFIIWCVKVITRNVMPEKVVKGIISTSVEGTKSYQCGTCGKKNEFFAIEIFKNLYVCSNCREYNLFENLD